MHPAFEEESYQITRGKNWCDEETRILIDILEEHFPSLLRKLRKGPEVEVMSQKLRARGFLRSRKEVQNKYKSLLADYRNEISNLKRQPAYQIKFKWFSRFDAMVKNGTGHISNGSESNTNYVNVQTQEREETVIKKVAHIEEQEKQETLERLLGQHQIRYLLSKLTDERDAMLLVKNKICGSLEELKSHLSKLDNTLSLISPLLFQLSRNYDCSNNTRHTSSIYQHDLHEK